MSRTLYKANSMRSNGISSRQSRAVSVDRRRPRDSPVAASSSKRDRKERSEANSMTTLFESAIQKLDESRDDFLRHIRGLSNEGGQVIFRGVCETLSKESQMLEIKVEASCKNQKTTVVDNKPCNIWNEAIPLPNSPRYACVGRVVTETPARCEIQKGDRVAAMISDDDDDDDAFRRYARISSSDVVKVPGNIDAGAALVMMVTYMTAYQSLSPGDTSLIDKRVMIVGGVGPVCQACIQLALLGRAKVFVPALREYHPFLSRLGANPIDCHPQDWDVRDKSMDIIVDAVCSDELFSPSMKLVKGGRLVSIGSAAIEASNEDDDFVTIAERFWFRNTARFMTCATFYGLMNSWQSDRRSFERDLNHLFYLYGKGLISPKISAYASSREYPKLRSGINGVVVCVPG